MTTASDKIKRMIENAKHISMKKEIIMVTSNKEETHNNNDYFDYSVTSEYFSNEEQSLICKSLENIGFKVTQFYNEEDFIKFVIKSSRNLSNYIVLNSAQKGTKIGRKSLIPSLCDLYNIKYIGSNPYIVSLCRDKYRTSCILNKNGINTPKSWLYDSHHGWINGSPKDFKELLIVKPNYESSSIGIDEKNIGYYDSIFLNQINKISSCYRQEVIVEEFIEGYEVETPVINYEEPITFFPVGIRLDSNPFMGNKILNYGNRAEDNYTFFNFSNLFPELSNQIINTASEVVKLLSIVGFGRIDFRIKENNTYYITDISTNPHYTEESSYHFLFNQLGFSYVDLVSCLISSSF